MTWERQEAGWYTSEIGSICKEGRWWVFYPVNSLGTTKLIAWGSWSTLKEAKRRSAIAYGWRRPRDAGQGAVD